MNLDRALKILEAQQQHDPDYTGIPSTHRVSISTPVCPVQYAKMLRRQETAKIQFDDRATRALEIAKEYRP